MIQSTRQELGNLTWKSLSSLSGKRKMWRMRHFLLIFAVVALVGCGKKKTNVIESEGDRKTVKQSVTKKTPIVHEQVDLSKNHGRLIAAKLSEGIATVAKEPSLVIKDFKGDINNVVWSPDSSKIMAGTVGVSDGQGKLSPAQVKIWDVDTGEELLTVVTPNASRNGVAWSPDGGRLAIKSGGVFSLADGTQAPGRLRIVAAKNGNSQISIETESHFMKEVISWSPDGKSLTGLIEDGIAVWEATAGKRVQTFDYSDSERSVRTLSWSPDGSRIAVGYDEAIVDIRNISNGKVLKAFKGGFMKIGNQSIKLPSFSTMVNSVAWSPNGKLIASANNHKVTIWGVASGTEAGTFKSGTEHLAWSPDGTQLAGSTRQHTTTDSITVWNVTRNAAGRRFVAHQRGISSLAWSPDGTKLVTGGKKRGGSFLEESFTLKIWSLK